MDAKNDRVLSFQSISVDAKHQPCQRRLPRRDAIFRDAPRKPDRETHCDEAMRTRCARSKCTPPTPFD